MKCLVIDNYDSFTDNLLHLFKSVKPNIDYTVLRNSDRKIFSTNFDFLIISPGPMSPSETGLLAELFAKKIIPEKIPTFGVCLGMQFINFYFGGKVFKSDKAMHGSAVTISTLDKSRLFNGIESGFLGARYNSLEIECVDNIKALAKSEDNMIMAIEHKELPIVGIQFHPESFLSENGSKIVENFFEQYI